MSNVDFRLVAGFLAGIKPEPRLSVSQWADRHRYLSPVSSAEPGLWRTARTPYLAEIMDCLSVWSAVQEVIVMKGAQVGMTEAGNNWLGYVVDAAPGPMLYVMPTIETAGKNSKIRIDPMIEATPVLREKIKPARSRDSGNTTYMKEFPGGVLSITGANSAAGLRSMPARYLFLDEVDAYPLDLEGEGNPLALAKARSRTFPRRKIFCLSTPTVQGASIIEAEFETTDQRYYHVPCPDCGCLQPLRFDQLRWEKGNVNDVLRYQKTTRYECVACGHLIEERFKTAMLSAGQWVASAPEFVSPTRRGYHINSLYAPFGWYGWADAAQDYDKAEIANDNGAAMKTFVNTVLGETYVEKGEVPEWKVLHSRRENYAMNKPGADVFFITAGADVQADRIEVEIVGWGKNKRSWSLDYRIFYGDTSQPGVWDDLAKIVDEIWVRPDGIELPLYKLCVDSGYNTSHVYAFCRRFSASRVYPIKGDDGLGVAISAPRAILTDTKGKGINAGTRVWRVGVSFLKSQLYGWLRSGPGDDGIFPVGYCWFPAYEELYFKGLTAEQLQFKIIRGYKRFEWVKTFDRNEPLDCRVYALAGACIAGIDRWTDNDYDALLQQMPRRAAQQAAAPPGREKRKSDFW